jgi:hypothetical protein
MNRCALISTLLLFAGHSFAGEEKALPFPKPSSFDASAIKRDPFVMMDESDLARQKLTISSMPGGPDPKSLFNVSTISLGRLSLVVINKHAFAEGEAFELKKDDKTTLQIRVLKIGDGFVDLDFDGTKLSVSLNRGKFKLFHE